MAKSNSLLRRGLRGLQVWLNRLLLLGVLSVGEVFFRVKGLRLRKGSLPRLPEVQSILVGRLDERIGDFVLMTPFLRELRRNAPQAWITLLVTPAVAELAVLCPYVNEVLVWDRVSRGACRSLRRYWQVLRLSASHLWARRFDLALLPRWGTVGGYHNILPLYWSGARFRVGFSERDANFQGRLLVCQDWLLTHAIHDLSIKHEVVRYLDLLRFLGGTVEDDRLELWLTGEDEAMAEEFLRQQGVSVGEPLVAFGIGATDLKRRWRPDGFIAVGRHLAQKHGTRIVLLGGKAEQEFAAVLADGLGSTAISAAGVLSLRAAAALLRRCRLYIGHDTGAMHLAAAVGVPVVEISCHPLIGSPYSWNAPQRFGPWGVPCRILQPPKPLPPCHNECNADKPHCILQIEPDAVIAAAEELLGLT
jgi:heptosyltransferase-2